MTEKKVTRRKPSTYVKKGLFKIDPKDCQSYVNIKLICDCGNELDIIWDENKFTMNTRLPTQFKCQKCKRILNNESIWEEEARNK